MPAHRLIATLHADPRFRAEADEVLRPLAVDARGGGTGLLDTLDAFLTSGGRYKATAEALHIHENTLRYRLARVEALTGRSLGSMADRVELWLALRARP
jgi:DNA-binding PucR family transcriptional regulator